MNHHPWKKFFGNRTTDKKSKIFLFSFKRGMTFVEVLLVAGLFSLISIALYNALSGGIRVWNRSRDLVIEEDIAIFFDKIASDLRNTFLFSQIPFEGNETKISFPTHVYTPADPRSYFPQGEYIDQIGQVEYYFEILDKGLYRRQANYSQSFEEKYGPPRLLIASIDRLKFTYFYITKEGEIASEQPLDNIPSTIEVEIKFTDQLGQRTMRKFINIPAGS